MNDNNANKEPVNTSQIMDFAEVEPEEEHKNGSEEISPTEKDGSQVATTLLREDEVDDWRSRWDSIQIGFVDEPGSSVKQADELVTEVMKQIDRRFSEKHTTLLRQWGSQEATTEDQRLALQSYRSFFNWLINL